MIHVPAVSAINELRSNTDIDGSSPSDNFAAYVMKPALAPSNVTTTVWDGSGLEFSGRHFYPRVKDIITRAPRCEGVQRANLTPAKQTINGADCGSKQKKRRHEDAAILLGRSCLFSKPQIWFPTTRGWNCEIIAPLSGGIINIETLRIVLRKKSVVLAYCR